MLKGLVASFASSPVSPVNSELESRISCEHADLQQPEYTFAKKRLFFPLFRK